MVYSSYERVKVQKKHPDITDQAEISRILGTQWKALSPGEQKPYRDEAKTLKESHSVQFPTYTYKPNKKERSRARKMGTGNNSDLSDGLGSGNQNVVIVMQEIPWLKELLPQEPHNLHRPADEQMPYVYNTASDAATAGELAGEEAVMKWIQDTNKELDDLESNSISSTPEYGI